MEIRKMTEGDLEIVAKMEKDIFSSPWSLESIKKAYDLKDNIYLVAMHEKEVVGYCGVWTSFETADLCNIAVAEKWRRKGIAQEILQELFGKCKEVQVQQILLEVRESNKPAIAFYKKNSFECIDIRRGYYKNPVENAIIMQREL